MLTAAVLSAFMSSTGAVAVLIPVVLRVARSAGVSPSRLLLPLSFGALLGGMLTLIGTPPNLVVSAALEEAELEPFRFLDFTAPGLVMTVGATLLLVGLRRRLLPTRAPAAEEAVEGVPRVALEQLVEEYDLGHTTHGFRVPSGSALVGASLGELSLPERFGADVMLLHPGAEETPGPDTRVEANALVVLQGEQDAVARAAAELGIEEVPPERLRDILPEHARRAAEVILTPRSQLLNQTLKETRFRDRFGLQVVGIRRKGKPLDHPLADIRLRFGDTLLVRGAPARLIALRSQYRQFVLVGEADLPGLTAPERRAPLAVAVVAGMVALLVTGVVPPVVAVLLAGGAMVFTRSVQLPSAYRAVSWESLILIAAMLPMATALDKTGGLDIAARALVDNLGRLGPYWTLAALFLATSALSLLMSNTATSVLLAPVALKAAVELGVEPHAFLMAVAFGASTAFSTPMASPTNTLVLPLGQYRFRDYLRAGVPLQLLVFALTMLVVPVFFPFR
jgi:di/tricarboxylate transporter